MALETKTKTKIPQGCKSDSCFSACPSGSNLKDISLYSPIVRVLPSNWLIWFMRKVLSLRPRRSITEDRNTWNHQRPHDVPVLGDNAGFPRRLIKWI